jgi:hypothetical protein
MTIVRITRSKVPVIGAGTDPSWFTNLGDLEGTYRGNTALSVKPANVDEATFNDIFRSYCGGAFDDDSDTFYTGPGAGHNNYDGAEIYGYDVIAEEWFQATTPSSAANGSDPADGQKVDGTPMATHTYDMLVMVDGELWLPAMGSVDVSNGVGSARGWVWDSNSSDLPSNNTRGWTTLGLHSLSGSYDVGATAYDPVTDKVWFHQQQTGGGTNAMASWNRSTKARTEHTITGASSFGDSGEDMLGVVVWSGSDSVFMGKGNTRVRTVNLQDALVGSTSWQTPTWTGSNQPSGKCRLHYIHETDQLVTWRIGTNQLIVCNRPANMETGTYAWFTVTLTGATITAPSEGASGVGSTNGTFGRFQIFRMPSGRLAVFLVNEVDQQVYIAKLPATAMAA